MSQLDDCIKRNSILITCGTGGVGKTTLSATLAVRAALLGKKALVVTIDPAKRLKTSLGLESLGDQPQSLTEQLRQSLPQGAWGGRALGELHALLPDSHLTLTSFFSRLAPEGPIRERILNNSLFKILSREFSGANEYMALEKLLALSELGRFDCIILDTPPSQNTLAFLNAPELMTQLFDQKLVRWVLLPTQKWFLKGISGGARKILGLLEKMTGSGFVGNLLDFFGSLAELEESFLQRVRRIQGLLHSPQTGFVMVAGPYPETIPQSLQFIEALRAKKLRFEAMVFNRTLGYLQKGATTHPDPALELMGQLQNRERRVIEQLQKNSLSPVLQLPELTRDVHSLQDLLYVALSLGPL